MFFPFQVRSVLSSRSRYIGLSLCLAFTAGAANPPDYSKEAAIVQEFAKDFTFAADGTWTCEQSAIIRIQSDAAVRQFGVLTYDYDRDNQTIEIEYVRVKKVDGTVVPTPSDNIQDVSSEITRIAPSYSDLREKQIPVKALSAGDILEYKVKFTQTKPEIQDQFWYSQNFLTGGVVLQETLRISTPAGKYVKVVSPGVKPEIREESGRKIYTWKTAQLNPTSQEEKKIAPARTSPAVQVTTFKSWDELGHWYGQLQQSRVTVTPAIQSKAAELTKGLTNATDKQRAIYNYVSTKFRYISLSFGIGRYQPHAADDVLSNQYGDCKDKHTLFASLLKAAGIESSPALISAGIKLDPDVPSPAQFNHVITVIRQDNGFVWLDTTPEVAPYGLLQQSLRDEKALLIPDNGPAVLLTTPADPPFPNSETVDAQGTLTADGTLKARFNVTSRGDDELILRSVFHQTAPVQWQELVQNLMRSQGFVGTVSNVDVDNPQNLDKPFHYAYDYVRTNYSDWPNRRIGAPLFPIGLPSSDSQEKPVEPILMGSPGQVTYRATVHLPKDFSAEIPDGTNVQSDFLGYSSNYAIIDGVLSAKREIVIKKSKVPVSAWGEYQKFAKNVVDDQNQVIQLAASTGPTKTVVVQNNPEAETLVEQAFQSLQRKDLSTAKDELTRAERLNPKQPNLSWAYANLYFFSDNPVKGMDALQKEIRNYPENVSAYRALAEAQVSYGHQEEAVETLRTLLKMAPNDIGAVSQLTALLIASKQYNEVPDLVRKALNDAPDNQQLRLALAQALLYNGRKEEGLAAVQKLAKDSSDGLVLNDVAFFLADTATDLPLAKEYAEKSVSTLENDSKEVSLSTLSNKDLGGVTALAAAWDTLGWVYFQLGDTSTAEKYLRASWMLSQNAAVADHLGQIYAKEDKQEAAIHAWRLALAANSHLTDTRERLRKMGVSPDPPPPTLHHRDVSVVPVEELGKLRTASLPEMPKQQGSAEFFVLFSAGKIEDAQFISGTDSLRSASSALMKLRYELPFPDDGPEKIARRGILSCSNYTTPSCNFVMLLPSTTTK